MYTKIQVVFDAAEPEKLAEFWGLALGYANARGLSLTVVREERNGRDGG